METITNEANRSRHCKLDNMPMVFGGLLCPDLPRLLDVDISRARAQFRNGEPIEPEMIGRLLDEFDLERARVGRLLQEKGPFQKNLPNGGPPFATGPIDAESPESTNRDPINHPRHYNEHLSGVECIEIVEHMSFNLGNAVKYIWRAGLKSADADQDLAKAIWYLERERKRLDSPKREKVD